MQLSTELYLVVGALAAAGGFAIIALVRGSRRTSFRAATRDRTPLNPEEFSKRYFPPAEQPIACGVRTVLDPLYPQDAALLEPDDLFALPSFVGRFDDALWTVQFVQEIERRFDVPVSNRDAKNLRTLRDVVDFIARQSLSDRGHT